MGNDVTILGGIIVTMLIVAFLIPFIQSEFGQTITEIDTDQLEGIDAEDIEDMNPVSWSAPFSIGKSLFNMFIWSYSFFPIWLILLHQSVKIILVILIYRLVRSGGG